MTKQNHKTGFLVAAMVFSAIALRVLGKFDILKVPGGIVRFPTWKRTGALRRAPRRTVPA